MLAGGATREGRGSASTDAPAGNTAGFVPDLMDRSKLRGVRFVRRPQDLLDAGEGLLVVDLSRAGVLEILPGLAGRRVVGFGSHVDRPTLDAARAAGCQALPRSLFFRTWPDLPAQGSDAELD